MEAKRILTALAILVLAAPFALGQTIIDNFEDGEFTSNPSWTAVENAGGTQSVTTNNAYNGQYAASLTTDGANDDNFNRLETPLDSSYVYDGTIPITARISSDTSNGAVRAVNVFTSTSDTLQTGFAENGSLYADTPTENATYAQTADADTWYNFKFLIDEGSTSVTIQVTNQQGTVLLEHNGTFSGTISNIQLMTRDTTVAATNTYYDYLTYNETSLSEFQFRMTSTSTTASNGSNSLYFSTSDMQYPHGTADGSSGETGYFSLASGTVSSEEFFISNVQVTPTLFPNENNNPNKAKAQVNFTVTNSEGFTGVSNTVELSNGATTKTATCSYTSVGAEARNYNCTAYFEYYDPADNYDLFINYTANTDTISYTQNSVLTYGQLVASQRNGDAISFNNAGPGKVNVRSDQQIGLKNTGNAPLNVTITSYDLQGRNDPSLVIDASNFKTGNASVSTATTLQNNQSITVYSTLQPGQSASQDFWFWLSMPAELTPTDYYSPNSWQIQGVAS